MSNVVSAAIVSGELIIGLDDGSIIRAGYVQGPQGLKGDQGPMGATGARGTDGSTIHTVKGPPPADLGKDGDYAINNRDWFIFGPKASGLWGAGQGMLPKQQKPIEAGKGGTTATGGGGGGGSGGSTGPIYTNTVQLTAPTRTLLASTTGYRVLPPAGPGKQNQQDANRWAFGEVFDNIDQAIPVHTGELPPATLPGFTDHWEGRLWFKTENNENRLYIYDRRNVDGTIQPGDWLPCTDIPPVEVGDTPPDEPREGDLWWDSSPDSLTLFVYEGSAWVPAAPPVSLDGINATISTALEVQAEILARLDSGETAQANLQDTVTDALDVQTTLKNRVEALEGTVVDGVWKYGSRAWPQNPGEFDIIDASTNKTTVWQDATTLRLYNTDNSGKVYTFSEVNVSDFIRIGAPGSSAVYRAMSAARPQGDYTEFLVEIVTHEDQAYEGILNYNFEFLPAFDATAYATIQYVNDQDDLDVKKTGDTMTGDLKMDGGDRLIQIINGNRLRIGARDSTNNGRTFLDIQTANSSGTAGTDAGYRCRIYHLATPTSPLHAANMQYVDDQVDGLATEEYVDDAIANIPGTDLSSYATKEFAEDLTYRPARLRWLFEGKDLGNTTPAHQSFKFDGKFIRCNFKTLNNVDLGVGLVGDTGPVEFTDGPVGIIWYRDGNLKWKMKQQFRVNAWRWNYNGHFEFARSSKHPDNDGTAFTVGAAYYITVGGFF